MREGRVQGATGIRGEKHRRHQSFDFEDSLEVEAKASVLTAALRLGTADCASAHLCRECEVLPLHELVGDLTSPLERLRRVFEVVQQLGGGGGVHHVSLLPRSIQRVHSF